MMHSSSNAPQRWNSTSGRSNDNCDRLVRKFHKLSCSRKCEHVLIRWMLLCLSLGSFLLLYNEIDNNYVGANKNGQIIKIDEIRKKLVRLRGNYSACVKELVTIKTRLSQHDYTVDQNKFVEFKRQLKECKQDVVSLVKRLGDDTQGPNVLMIKKKLYTKRTNCTRIDRVMKKAQMMLVTRDKLQSRQMQLRDKMKRYQQKIEYYERLNEIDKKPYMKFCKTKEFCPPYVWSPWSTCSKNCEGGRRFREAVYTFLCVSDDVCKRLPDEYEECNTEPCGNHTSKDGNDLPINRLNPPILLGEGKDRCGFWQDDYIKLHQDMLSGKTEARYLVYTTGSQGSYPNAGGFAHRIKGITTVFFLALLTRRAFLIEWMDQEGLNEMLEPKYIKWSQSDFLHQRYYKRPPIRDIGSWRSFAKLNRTDEWYRQTNFNQFFNLSVELVAGHGYDFTYAVLQNKYFGRDIYKYRLDTIKCRICCVWDFLFQQTYTFNKYMTAILKEFNYPTNPLVVMHIKVPFKKKIGDIMEYSVGHYICSNKAIRENHFTNVTKTITTNQRLLRHMMGLKHKDIKVPTYTKDATQTVHYHIGDLPPSMDAAILKGVLRNTIIDFFLLLNSTVIIRERGYQHWFASTGEAIRHHYHPDRLTYIVDQSDSPQTPRCNKRTPIIAPLY